MANKFKRHFHTLILTCLLIAQSVQATPIQLNFLEWGYLPEGYEQRFQQYAKTQGYDVKLSSITPYISDFDSIYDALRRGKADVVMPANFFLKAYHAPLFKLLLPIDNSRLKNFSQLRPIFQKTQFDKEGPNHYAVPHSLALFSLAYETQQFSQDPIPSSWDYLLQESSQNTFSSYCDQFEPLIISTMLALGESPKLFENGQIIKDPQLQTKITTALRQRLTSTRGFWYDQENNCDDLINQKVATTWGLELVKCNAQNNQSWKIAVTEEGPIYSLDTLSISRRLHDQPEKLALAYLLIDFLISKEQQALVLKGVPTIQGVNQFTQRVFSDDELAVLPDQKRPEFDERLLIPPLPSHVKNRYKRMLTGVLEKSQRVTEARQCNWDLNK